MKTFVATLLMFPVLALSAEYDLGWEPPTARVDGTPLYQSDIDSYELWVDDTLVIEGIDPMATSLTFQLDSGQRCMKMRTKDTEGRVGPFSDATCKNIKGLPNAPVIISIDFAGS